MVVAGCGLLQHCSITTGHREQPWAGQQQLHGEAPRSTGAGGSCPPRSISGDPMTYWRPLIGYYAGKLLFPPRDRKATLGL